MESNTTEKNLIFFVDDDQDLLDLVQVKLGKKFSVKTFSDPLECIDISDKMQPKLLIVDLNMPNIDGFEVLKQLRGHPGTSSIPIVCTSASTKQADRNRAEKLGAIGFLSKPYNIKSLSDDIAAIIDNLNKRIVSDNERSVASICFNEAEKRRLILKAVREELDGGETVVLLSWERGEDYLDDDLLEKIELNQLIFLEMGPSLITKLPYLEDVSPIFEDIENLVGDLHLAQASLVMDDPQNLFGHNNSDRALATTLTLSRVIRTTFKKSHVFMAKNNDPEKRMFTMKLAGVFGGRSS